MTRIVINRIAEGTRETLGHGTIFANDGREFNFVTLELPNKHNKRNISSIPTGVYRCEVITRPNRKEKAILIKDVPLRSAILMHLGNFYTDIKGCILPGERFRDIDKNGITDVINSVLTMEKILSLCPDEHIEFQIEIKKLAL